MEIQIAPELDGFMEYAIAKGHYQSREQAVQAALAMWEDRERVRIELIDNLEAAERSIAAGQGIEISSEEELDAFFDRVKQRGRARVAQG